MPRTTLALAAALLAGCAIPVTTDFDREANWSALESFAWLEPPVRETAEAGPGGDPFVHNSLLDKRVRAAVDSALVARGYRPAGGEEEPDFLLRYRVTSRQKLRDSPVYVGGGVGYRRYPYGVGSSVVYGGTDSYEEGTLILDVIDPESEILTWRGWAAARTRDGYFDADRVERYVVAILAKFPPER